MHNMPFGIHKHSNRSKQAVNEPAAQGTAFTSESSASSTDEAKVLPSPQQQQQPQRADIPSFVAIQAPGAELDRGTNQRSGDLPARSQSTRYQGSPQQQPLTAPSADDLVLESRRIQQQQQQQQRYSVPSSATEPKKSKSLFDRMRSSNRISEQRPPAPPQGSYNNTTGLARRLSKRQDAPPVFGDPQQQRNSVEQQQRLDWQTAQDSRSRLHSPQEGAEDDGGLDPYFITETDQDEHCIAGHEQAQQPTIRPVQGDPEPPLYQTNEDSRQHSQGHQQHSLSQAQHQQVFEAPAQNHYQQPIHNQHLNPLPDSLGIIHDQFRQQNPETVSQLSYESPSDQGHREEQQQRPVSGNSSGHSPTGSQNLPQQHFPSRTISIVQGSQGPRPLSQYSGMAPPTGASQQSRRSADAKQTLQGNPGPPDSRDGAPPGYQQRFPGGSTPTAGPGTSPIPPALGSQGPNYRGGPPQREQYGPSGGGEQGRSTPPPAPGDRDVNDAYKELRKLESRMTTQAMLSFLQCRSIKKSRASTSTKQHKLSNCRTHSQTNVYHNREPPLMIANI